ncbi:hypothetical protein GQ43DRAFT_426009 [Delitschia confertaspora ATCC 74209]|uniref:Extracellular membrane protein CFEM domain-containing protein n=1 Tax=Delitschia confertaspora ATCC 74209 TaxID=1513339 RepID=A0A9P4MR77_9PLEO|nr:hypothetical protein GQ43DRAFT_426009 [Delitschia confertaspora ATCC 74209]
MQLLLATLLATHAAATVVSLSNFVPQVNNLPPNCDRVYSSTIPNCEPNDFEGQCSKQCISGLASLSKSIIKECAGVDVPETSIVGVFLLGQGVGALCKGAQAPVEKSTSTPLQMKTTVISTKSASTTERSSSSSAKETETTSPISSTEPSTTPAPTFQSPTTSQLGMDTASMPKPSPTSNSQKSNHDSGGGSPFDIQAGTASALRSHCLPTLVVLGAVALGFGVLM